MKCTIILLWNLCYYTSVSLVSVVVLIRLHQRQMASLVLDVSLLDFLLLKIEGFFGTHNNLYFIRDKYSH